MTKTALVTGLSGFVGSHLKTALEKQGITVIGLPHNLFYGYEDALDSVIQNVNPDYIFHLASYGNMFGQEHDDDIYAGNLYATFNLLKASRNIDYKNFIYISSSSVLLPYVTMYSAAKMGAEQLCKAYANKYGKSIIIMRPFSLYGVGEQESHLIPRIFRSCLYDEPLRFANSPIHDYVYVEDFVKTIITYAMSGKVFAGESVHVGTGNGISNYWLLNEIEMITDRRANIIGDYPERPYDNEDWICSSHLGQVEFTQTNLYDGLQKVYSSYKL